MAAAEPASAVKDNEHVRGLPIPPINIKQEIVDTDMTDDTQALLAYYVREQEMGNLGSSYEDAKPVVRIGLPHPVAVSTSLGAPTQGCEDSRNSRVVVPVGLYFNKVHFGDSATCDGGVTESGTVCEEEESERRNAAGNFAFAESEFSELDHTIGTSMDEGQEQTSAHVPIGDSVSDPVGTVLVRDPVSALSHLVSNPVSTVLASDPLSSVSHLVSNPVSTGLVSNLVSETLSGTAIPFHSLTCVSSREASGINTTESCDGKQTAYLNNIECTYSAAKPYSSNINDKASASTGSTGTPKQGCTSTGGKHYLCNICFKTFSNLCSLTHHRRTHKAGKNYPCNLCGKTFSRSAALDKHECTQKGEKTFTCGTCSKTFSQVSDLTHHERTHKTKRPYKCKFCSKAFPQPAHLQLHERTHTGEKPYKCNLCPKAYACLSSLLTHERIHRGEKPYKCDCCTKAFACLSNLLTHKHLHTGAKPYKCNVCSKGFSHLSNLRKHERTHTGDKPYACGICTKTFALLGNLKQHERTHTGEKPYKCEICSQVFSRSSSLKRHAQTHSSHLEIFTIDPI